MALAAPTDIGARAIACFATGDQKNGPKASVA
jgi:hypothetical protein